MTDSRRWLYGPGFHAWLVRQGVGLSVLSSNEQRSMHRWRNGANADFFSVDRMLTRLGFHETDIPDDLWLKKRAWNGRSKHLEPEGKALLKEGLTGAEVARQLKISVKRVYLWRKELVAEGVLDK